ncbi:hypothetical protein EU528_11985 [Candidatus Thorarchaeota archaeon]|nr:MAG: hypothetical protein EU528_11985 [Candidatus Thorarchaeota archaeon]
MNQKRLTSLALILVLIGAGTGIASYILISNTIDYEVIFEGEALTLVEITGPAGPLTRGVNNTFHAQITANIGNWNCRFAINVTSPLITDSSDLLHVYGYVNDTWAIQTWSATTPDTINFDTFIGTIHEGETIDIFWTINFDFEMPVGAYNLKLFVLGESQVT